MKKWIAMAAVLGFLGAVSAQQRKRQINTGLGFWTTAELNAISAGLKAKEPAGNGNNMYATTGFDFRGNYSAQITRRDESGVPEIHAGWSDVFIAREGEATLLYGGKIEGGKENRPGEIGGGKLVGAQSKKMAPGDMAFIPAGMPHQTVVAPGRHFTVMILKVIKP